MSTVSRRGGAAVEIPASTKKVVQDLREVVGNSEEEIYAMLKECNMDPNETAQRLLNQGDPFHEVRRKRDKKKDSGALREGADVRGRPGSGGSYGRGGGRGGGGGGRGSSLPRFGSQEHGGGRGRPFGRENGIHPSSRGSSAVPNSNSVHSQTKPSVSSSTSVLPSATSQPAAAPQAQAPGSVNGNFSVVANGSSGYVRPAPVPQGAWASGHGTMADILKAQAAPSSIQAPSATVPPPAFSSAQTSVSPSYPEAAPFVQSSDESEFYSSSTDPVLHSSVDSRSGNAQGAIGAVGNQRPIGDRPVSTSSVEMSLGTGVAMALPLPVEPSPVPVAAAESRDAEAQVEVAVVRLASPVSVMSPVSSEDLSGEEAGESTDGGRAQEQESGGRNVLGGSQYNGQPLYAPPLQPVGTQKVAAAGGVSLEWKPKVLDQSSTGASSTQGAVDPTMIVQSYQALSLQDDEPVIIPTHFRVPEADRSHLSFGSFGSDFNTGFGTSFGLEEVEKTKHVETIAAEEAPVEQAAAPASVETQVEMVQSYGHQQGPTIVDSMSGSVEAASMVHQGSLVGAQEQHLKPDPVVQQSPGYFLGASNYPGFGLMPQMPGGQYGYEQAESQAQDVSRIPSMGQPAYEPTTSYYTSAFRGADADRLYPPYAPTNASSKYSGNIGAMAAPSLPSSQEGVNPMMVSAGPSAAPSSQAGSNVQSAQAIPQQALPMHYPQQAPSGHFGNFVGYQYVPQSYPYLQPPYPHHMYNSSNSAYAQLPAGSSYPPTGGSSYPSGGAAAVKFPVMPQYKPVAGAGNAPQSGPGIGYGGYTTTPSGYGSNPAVTAGNASGYEDVNTSHYKDNTLYISSQQQGDSSTVWIQASNPRDSGVMQTSAYYNLASQGQHSGYPQHSQQPAHGHAHPNPAYANLYHPSQAGPAASHQMLQQPQGMGGGAGNTQPGGYQQQPQRTQQSWNNSNY